MKTMKIGLDAKRPGMTTKTMMNGPLVAAKVVDPSVTMMRMTTGFVVPIAASRADQSSDEG